MGDFTMASPSASTSAASELPPLGGIEALRLKVGPVKRSLFGPVDHQQLQQDFQRILRMGVEVANKRWNFDFQGDKPGLGPNMEWEELSFQEVPGFYRSCTVRSAPSGAGIKRRFSSSSGEGSPASGSSSSSGEEYLEITTRECYRLESGKRRQAVITDFFKVKRNRLVHYKDATRQ
ncbi:cyclin-dependent kinase inhibitor 1D isoform X1 [Periophthalmus magnuspinnatus]|uniref:cyclin-dependent kinase inhibitor 1D isoform X1 n=1 Tax=Periophthalmus magnuspinnatus TaxID=409849 RepID=UPI00145B370E|nr:cyclin-dependent kinase inhibitor 1D isoform X1 [Periophthalmus magnuspinnatus]